MTYLITEPLENDEWLMKRQKLITGTQAIFALQHFASDENVKALTNQIDNYKMSKKVFYTKKHLPSDMYLLYNDLTYTNSIKAGNKLESKVAEKGFEILKEEDQEYNDATIACNGKAIWLIENEPVGATPDYVITKKDGSKELLECKTTTIEFESDAYKNMIQKYKIQCQHQLLCSGLKACYLVICFLDKNRTEILDTKIEKIEENKQIQKWILEACKACVKWLEDVENGIETLEETEEPTEDEIILDNLLHKNLETYLNEYGDAIVELQQKQKHLEKVKDIVKLICKYDITVDGWNIDFRKQKTTFYTPETVQEKIDKLEKEIGELKETLQLLKDKPDSKLISRQGAITNIKISKVDNKK